MEQFRSVDGANNNANDPNLGQVDTQLLRKAPSAYGDGISTLGGESRPMAREISNTIFAQSETSGNEASNSDLMWMWGQFLDHDLSLTENGLSSDNAAMSVPTGDLMFDPLGTGDSNIAFTRSIFDPATGTDAPRQQINEITPFIDGSMIYGSDDVRLDALRNDDGKLVMSDGGLMGFNEPGLPNAPSTDSRLFLAGDVRANENVGLTSLHTLFAREHNRLVDQLSQANPEWDGNRLFQEARKLVEAEIQIITFEEFLPRLLGEDSIGDYEGYDQDVNPQIANEFSTAAYRLGHTMLSSEIKRLEEDGSESAFGNLQLRDAFFRPDRIIREGGIDDVLRGAAVGEAEQIDAKIVDDVRNFLFGPPGAGGFDLASLNIQRGRDHGLADFNTVRNAYGLEQAEEFSDITSDLELQGKLEQLYGSVDNIDLFVGGLAEDTKEGSQLGELFHTIVVEQFTRTRDGDSFWHENNLSTDELALVQGVRLADIIERNSDVDHMQDDVFTAFDRVGGTEDADLLTTNEENVLMIGGTGDDELLGGRGVQQFEGGADNDRLYGRHDDDILNGGDGQDQLYGGYGNDRLSGGTGDDFLTGALGQDRLDGGAGDDTMRGGRDADVFVFSDGRDVVQDFDKQADVLDFMGSELVGGMDDLEMVRDSNGVVISDTAGNSMQLIGLDDLNGVTFNFRDQVIVQEPDPKDWIAGEAGDLLLGTAADDFFGNTDGKQVMLGLDGNDTVVFSGAREEYDIQEMQNGMFKVSDEAGYDFIWQIENLRFDDMEIDLTNFDAG